MTQEYMPERIYLYDRGVPRGMQVVYGGTRIVGDTEYIRADLVPCQAVTGDAAPLEEINKHVGVIRRALDYLDVSNKSDAISSLSFVCDNINLLAHPRPAVSEDARKAALEAFNGWMKKPWNKEKFDDEVELATYAEIIRTLLGGR